MTINIVTGPPCSGKSTWARKQLNDGDVIVDYDHLAKTLGSPGHHDHPTTVGQVTMAARAAAVARIFKGIEANSWILASFLTQDKIDEYEKAGCTFHLVDPGIEECLKRCETDNRPPGTQDRIRKWYEQNTTLPQNTNHVYDGEKAMTTTHTRTKSFNVTALAGSEVEGVFEGYASVFNNIDSYGDKVLPGAFAESLKSFNGGVGIPCYWSHRTDDPLFNIGSTLSAVEDGHGLRVKVALDLETERGRYVYKLLKEGRVREMSFMYTVKRGRWVEEKTPDGTWLGYYELQEVEIHEVSLVPVGANRETEILTVKAPGAQPGASVFVCEKCAQKSDVSEGQESSKLNAEEPQEVNAEEVSQDDSRGVKTVYGRIKVMEMTTGCIPSVETD